MKVLLDEDLPHKLRLALAGHEVLSVSYAGWAGLKNGTLLSAAEEAGFEVFLTADKSLPYQQNLKQRRIAIVVLSVQDWPFLKHRIVIITAVLSRAEPYSFQLIELS